MLEYKDLSGFTRGYVEAVFFTDASPDAPEEIQEKGFSDFAPETVDKIVRDCAAFELGNRALLECAGSAEQNGHDFWLTRNRHGTGFWDRGYNDDIGKRLTEATRAFPELSLVCGSEGLLYLE